MPKETFLKLSEEKKQKVLNAAKREFARVPIEQVSIKNIVEDAEIARGSFYQYFESKEDLLAYILKENADEIDTKIKNKIYETKGNIFDAYIELYDLMVKKFVENTEQEFFKQIFINLRLSDESLFTLIKSVKPQNIIKYFEMFDKTSLKINVKNDFILICDMLNVITRRAIVKNFKGNSQEECRQNFLKQIDYLKYGIIKKEE